MNPELLKNNTMNTLKTTPTPELDKMLSHRDTSQSIGEFIEWLQTEKKVLFRISTPERIDFLDEKFEMECKKLGLGSPEERAHRYNNMEKWEEGGGIIPFHMTIEKMLAEYFNIDLDKCEKEKRAILENLREAKDK